MRRASCFSLTAMLVGAGTALLFMLTGGIAGAQAAPNGGMIGSRHMRTSLNAAVEGKLPATGHTASRHVPSCGGQAPTSTPSATDSAEINWISAGAPPAPAAAQGGAVPWIDRPYEVTRLGTAERFRADREAALARLETFLDASPRHRWFRDGLGQWMGYFAASDR